MERKRIWNDGHESGLGEPSLLTRVDGMHQCQDLPIPPRDLPLTASDNDLPDEAASRLFEKGLNPMDVSAITGHKTLQMLKRYIHPRAEDLAKRMG